MLKLEPEDIDTGSSSTHLHADHVGWNTKLENGRWVPTFPNARYICGTQEYKHWSNTYKIDGYLDLSKDSVLPIVEKGQMELLYKMNGS